MRGSKLVELEPTVYRPCPVPLPLVMLWEECPLTVLPDRLGHPWKFQRQPSPMSHLTRSSFLHPSAAAAVAAADAADAVVDPLIGSSPWIVGVAIVALLPC